MHSGVLKQVYLDHNATTPLDPEVRAQIPEWLDCWGNPSSIHWAGRKPKALIREARREIASALGVDPLELIFTSGGSEANNLALKGILNQRLNGRDELVVSAVEHPSVRKAADHLAEQGYRLHVIPVDRRGQLDLAFLQSVLNERTALVSVMVANNETGHLMPVAEVARLAHAVGALVHCDAVQGLGKIELKFREWGVDLASLSGHKFYALKGCGVLYARRGLNLGSLVHGGGQERGRRAGTENALAMASLGFMCRRLNQVPKEQARIQDLRDHLERRILSEISGVTVTGASFPRLANTSSLTLQGVDGETLLINLDVRGYAVSTGAACSAGSPEPSPVLLAMGLTRSEAQSSLRLSLGWGTELMHIDQFVEDLKAVVARLRSFHPEATGVAHGL